jgi:hypothetical protein
VALGSDALEPLVCFLNHLGQPEQVGMLGPLGLSIDHMRSVMNANQLMPSEVVRACAALEEANADDGGIAAVWTSIPQGKALCRLALAVSE